LISLLKRKQKVPYAFNNFDWVGYDEKESIRLKARYANKLNLNGISFWSLDLDDFSGEWCSQGKYPLFTTAIQEFLNPTQPTTDIQRVDDVLVQIGCRQNQGYYVNKATQCKNYYVCYETQNQFEAIELACQDDLRFD
jgi:GH18 family chitinase